MVAAGYAIELIFQALGLVPEGPRHASVGETSIHWNYTSVLNIIFLALAALLLWRFFSTGGRTMLSMMGGGPDDRSVSRGLPGPDAGPGPGQVPGSAST
jgi:hypothetical protein